MHQFLVISTTKSKGSEIQNLDTRNSDDGIDLRYQENHPKQNVNYLIIIIVSRPDMLVTKNPSFDSSTINNFSRSNIFERLSIYFVALDISWPATMRAFTMKDAHVSKSLSAPNTQHVQN
jgi:hypothetical protein